MFLLSSRLVLIAVALDSIFATMSSLSPDYIFRLLQKISSTTVETYNNFPEIIRAGSYQLEKDDVDYLCTEGFLEEKKVDSFGKFLELSDRGRAFLRHE